MSPEEVVRAFFDCYTNRYEIDALVTDGDMVAPSHLPGHQPGCSRGRTATPKPHCRGLKDRKNPARSANNAELASDVEVTIS
jgi:hypothetical protein